MREVQISVKKREKERMLSPGVKPTFRSSENVGDSSMQLNLLKHIEWDVFVQNYLTIYGNEVFIKLSCTSDFCQIFFKISSPLKLLGCIGCQCAHTSFLCASH